MNILIVSERYSPSVGGVETVTRLLAAALQRVGHETTILTNQPGNQSDNGGCRVVRRPGILQLLRLYARAEAVIVQGPALRLAWPLLCRHRNALMVHHLDLAPRASVTSKRLRAALASRVRHATVSRAMAQKLPFQIAAILPNPYDSTVFQIYPDQCRHRDIIFVGRLVPEKGADVLIQALAHLGQAGKPVTATIVGAGPERDALQKLAKARGVASRLWFAGQITGKPLARLLNEHRLLVVPSMCHESFALVALEGAACGCTVVASDIAGLPEAVGNCGLLFPPGDAASLADSLAKVLGAEALAESFHRDSASHLKRHEPMAVATRYLHVLSHKESTPVRATGRKHLIHADV